MKTYIHWIVLCALVVGLALVGCRAAKPDDGNPELSFRAEMQVNANQEFHASLGVENRGDRTFGGDETFDGEMELRYADGEQAGELRARAEIVTFPELKPGDTAWPMTWRGQLDPGAYLLTWGAEGYGETRVEFQVVERDGRLYLGS